MAPEPSPSSLVTQDKQEDVLKTNLEGNLTLERVQRGQSGTYGCRVEDYDADEDAELSQTLELRVACESPGRVGWGGPWPRLPRHPRLPWLCRLMYGPDSHTGQPESSFQSINLTFPRSRTCRGSPVPSGKAQVPQHSS